MRTESQTSTDRTVAVIPAIVCDHPDDVAEVEVSGRYRIFVRFRDGISGLVDLSRLIHSADAGVFAELADEEVFAKAEVVLGAVTWPGEIDLAPDAMYAALTADGVWVL